MHGLEMHGYAELVAPPVVPEDIDVVLCLLPVVKMSPVSLPMHVRHAYHWLFVI